MTRGSGRISLGSHKGIFTGFAAAVLACLLIQPISAHACGPKTTKDGLVALPALLSMEALSGLSNATVAASEDDPSIVGLWYVTFVSGGQVFDIGYDQWHSDGTEILNDTVPPQPANGTGTVCLGVYKRTQGGTIKTKHPYWSFDANGNFAGYGLITESITVDPAGKTYHGSFVWAQYDVSGNLVFKTTGTLSAQRITP